MKAILPTLLLAIGMACSARAQTVTAVYDYVIQRTGHDLSTNDFSNLYRKFTVKEGESISIYQNGGQALDGSFNVKVTFGGTTGDWSSAYGYDIPGPAEVTIDRNTQPTLPDVPIGSILTVVRVKLVGNPYPPNKTIIIPAGAKGGSLDLEMSTDLVIWTPTIPGTYTSPTNNLFFRLSLKSVP